MGCEKCFKCGQRGHIGANCQSSSPKSANSSPSSSSGKGAASAKAKPAAKAGKGKMHLLKGSMGAADPGVGANVTQLVFLRGRRSRFKAQHTAKIGT